MDIVLNEQAVGNDDGLVRQGVDNGGAQSDLHHVSLQVVDQYPVAFLDRPFEDDDQAREEVSHHTLQSKADTDAQHSENHGDGGEVYPDHRQTDQYDQDHDYVSDKAGNGKPLGFIQG